MMTSEKEWTGGATAREECMVMESYREGTEIVSTLEKVLAVESAYY